MLLENALDYFCGSWRRTFPSISHFPKSILMSALGGYVPSRPKLFSIIASIWIYSLMDNSRHGIDLVLLTWYGFSTGGVTKINTHNYDVIMSAMAPHITSTSIVYSTICSSADQRKHQSSASLTFVRWIHRSPVNSPHKGPVTRNIFTFNDVIMISNSYCHVAWCIVPFKTVNA